MTSGHPNPPRPDWAGRGLLSALVGLALVLAGIVVGAVPAAAGNRVGVWTPTAANTVGSPVGIGAGQLLGNTSPQPQIVVATAVATNNVPGGGGTGRAKNHLRPDPDATGPHTTFRRDADTGQVNHYAEWIPNPHNPSGWDLTRRFDLTGKPHFNKATQEWVPTPHVQGPSIPGGVRSADPWEVPK